MKSRAQKTEELKKGKELLEKSAFLLFTDFTKVTAEGLRKLRRELRKSDARFLVIKKRLLGLLLKEKKIDFDTQQFKISMGTVFAPDIEQSAGSVYRFFKEMKEENTKILGGYNLTENRAMTVNEVLMIGALPAREVLLGQLLGMIAAPIRSFLYILSERSKKIESAAPAVSEAVTQAGESPSAPPEAASELKAEAALSGAAPSAEQTVENKQ